MTEAILKYVLGPLISGGLNLAGQGMQNLEQERFYTQYMSPAARMAQMKAAGINPAAAAQGISGAPAPQMNAAPPTGAFTGLGEQLQNAFEKKANVENTNSDTNLKDVEADSIALDNDIKRIELGMKPEMLQAELDDLKESANQKRQAIEESKTEVDKIKAEKAKLEQEKEFIISQIGLVEYDKRVKEADAALKNAEAGLARANKELTDVNKQIAEKERDNYLTPEERITKEGEAQEKVGIAVAKAREEAHVENDPESRAKKELTDRYKKESSDLLSQLDELKKELRMYTTGRKKDNYFNTNRSTLEYQIRGLEGRLAKLREQYYDDMRRLNNNKSVSVGLHGVSESR